MAIARATGGFLDAVRRYFDGVASVHDDDLRENYLGTLRKAKDILESHAVQEANISVDPTLSEAGQEARIIEVAKESLKKLRFVLQAADDAAAAYVRMQSLALAVPDPPKGANEVVVFLRESELRTWLRSLPAAERMKEYQLAVNRDDVETIRAVRLAPGPALIPTEILERFDRARLELTRPKEVARLQSLAVVRDQLYELANLLFAWLRGYGARWERPTPPIRSGQHLVGYGDEVKFPTAPIKPATNLT